MLHPSDASLIGLYSISTHTTVSVVCVGKTKIYSILFEPSCSRYRIPIISKAYKNITAGVCFDEETNKLWFWGTETGGTATKFLTRVEIWNFFKILGGKGTLYCKQWSVSTRQLFSNKNRFTISASLTGLIFTEICFCFFMRGVGHLTRDFLTQMAVVFRLSQG